MSCAGTVLSQPRENDGVHRLSAVISSTSMLMRLRNFRLVGERNNSPSEMVGKSSGKAPAASTSRLTASRSSGICR